MNKEDICFMSAYEMVEKIKSQELSSQEITEKIIERIEKVNPKINAYSTTTFDLARETAKKADNAVKKGKKLGILHGVPCSIKDLIETKGIRTTFGCKIFENHIPMRDEAVIRRLKDAGIIILGKTNSPAYGYKGVTDNLIFGATKNPWNLEKTSGGSSGGAAAAVVSGLGPLALGSDGGGSIRIPSCFCGSYGLKPTFGRIPQGSMQEFGYFGSLVHYGPIVRYVKDAALMLDAMVGQHESDRYSLPKPEYSFMTKLKESQTKLKFGYSLDLGYAKVLDNEVKRKVLEAIEKFEKYGFETEEIKIQIKYAEEVMNTFWTSGFAFAFKDYLPEWENKIDGGLVAIIKHGLKYSVQEIKLAEVRREQIHKEICRQFRNIDVLITPTLACIPFDLGIDVPEKIDGKETSPLEWLPFTYPFNLSGHPAASIPCGWSNDGLPIGMQIVGKRFDELLILQISKIFEQIAPWQDKKPSLD
jgi:aspartyl-tRNA(Asn)/glutamyl-tRNA(Gln) amidotransferase subunit A